MDNIRKIARKLWIEVGFVTPVTTSIVRDCLQAERSLLLYCKLSGVLAMISIVMVLDYNLEGTATLSHAPHFSKRTFSKVVGTLFFFLALVALALGAFNYYNNVYHFFRQTRFTGPKLPTQWLLGTTVLLLLAINISLLVDSQYWDES